MKKVLQKLSVLCLLIMASTVTWADVQEKTIVKSNFSDWEDYTSCADKSTATTTTGKITTKYSKEDITFTLYNTNVYTGGDGKISAICASPAKYLCGMKETENNATITTSAISSVTTVSYTHRATGSSRGWGLKVKGTKSDGTKDADWVTVYSTTCSSANVTVDPIEINRTDVQLQWYNLSAGNYAALTDLVINGNVEIAARTFTDFKVDFRVKNGDKDYTVVTPTSGTLPTGIELNAGSYKDAQHGAQKATITVPVDGPVKFYIGGCNYTNGATVSIDGGTAIAIDTKTAGCENSASDISSATYTKYATYTYNVEEAATLTFSLGSYCPYFIAEACEFVPSVTVSYYNTDGKLIGEETVDGGSALKYKYSASDVTVPEGEAFRGWFAATDATATKVAEDTPLNEDIKLYAKTSTIEKAEVGAHFDWDLTKPYFYDEDHEVITLNGAYHDTTHGWTVNKTNSVQIAVAGKAYVTVKNCKFSNTQTATVTDASGNQVTTFDITKNETEDGAATSFKYDGDATTLTITYPSSAYVHEVEVYNVSAFAEKDATTGYYNVASGDGATLMMLLKNAADGDKIFLPNGTYDFGNACITPISANNVSLIGESMDGTIIKNKAITPAISTTAVIQITGTNTYLQDLTLENDYDYYSGNTYGVAVALHDKGTKTICKNVKLLSCQDTYYSNKTGALKYFEDGEVHGTVDYICGDGSVYFKGMKLVNRNRTSAGGGSDAITASNANTADKGYVFEGCTITYDTDMTGTLPVVSLGRAWNNAPRCVYLNTIVDNSNGTLNFSKSGDVQRWTLAGMNTLPTLFGEYNTVDENGQVVSPTENNCTFTYKGDTKEMNTIISATDAASYTIENVLGDWAATAQADAKQVTEMPETGTFLVNSEITTTKPTSGKVRVANARGGFGPEIDVTGTAINKVENAAEAVKDGKYLINNQIVIVKDGKKFSVAGVELK